MPRCLRLHKVHSKAGFCAICGSRVLPGWVWWCLCALPLSLFYAVMVSWRVATFSPIKETVVITATELSHTTTPHLHNVTPRLSPSLIPTSTFTPTGTPLLTASSTPTATLSTKVAIQSFHHRYVTALGEEDKWVLKQELELGDCGWFTQSRQSNGKITLVTCKDRYVTASAAGSTRWDWQLRQETSLSECGQFETIALGNGTVAFKTCAGRFFTAGDGNWPLGLQWLIVAEAEMIQDWERFTLVLSP